MAAGNYPGFFSAGESGFFSVFDSGLESVLESGFDSSGDDFRFEFFALLLSVK